LLPYRKARLFVTSIHFRLSLIFVSKAGSLPFEWSPISSSTLVGSRLVQQGIILTWITCQGQTLKLILPHCQSRRKKKFYNTGCYWSQSYKTFLKCKLWRYQLEMLIYLKIATEIGKKCFIKLFQAFAFKIALHICFLHTFQMDPTSYYYITLGWNVLPRKTL
jgi:hypothetical protein